jgi:hypothetical protein
MSDALNSLLHSRKFLIALLDAAGSLLLYFAGKYLPNALEDTKFLIVTLQPVILLVIAAYAYEDAQTKAAIAAVDRQFLLVSSGTNAHGTQQTR